MITDIFDQQHLRSSLHQTLKANFKEIIIQRQLSRGSYGMVFLAKTISGKQQYALKAIVKNKKRNDMKKIIDNQIKIHQSLRSKFIVKFFKKFQDEDYTYIVLQYCPQGDLRNLLKQYSNQIPIKILKDIGLQIAKGISTLHSKNLVHRDIKLQNILYCQTENSNNQKTYEIKICDFGAAAYLKQGLLSGMHGTPGYTAPQILTEYNQKVDVWSYGCLLYVLATNHYLFPINKFTSITQKMVENLKFNENLPRDLINLFHKIFVFDFNERISMKQIIKHPFFNEKQMNFKRKLSNQISEKSDYELQKVSMIKQSNNSIKSSPKSISSIAKKTNKNDHKYSSKYKENKYLHDSGIKPPTFRQDKIKSLKDRMNQITENQRHFTTGKQNQNKNKEKQKLQLKDKYYQRHSQHIKVQNYNKNNIYDKNERQSVKNLKAAIQNEISKHQQSHFQYDKQNDKNYNNLTERYPSAETKNFKQNSKIKQKYNINSQINLNFEIKQHSNKIIDSKFGKIKSNQLGSNTYTAGGYNNFNNNKNKYQPRQTVPTKSRPSSYNSTHHIASKTADMIRKTDKKTTLGKQQKNQLIIERKTQSISPINIQKMPQTEEIQCSRGKIKISEAGFFKRPLSPDRNSINNSTSSYGGSSIHITPDGMKITLTQGRNSVTYTLQKLPQKYKPMYKFWKNVINIMKERTQLSKIQYVGGNQLKIMVSGKIIGKINKNPVQFKNEEDLKLKIDFKKSFIDLNGNKINQTDLKKFGKVYNAMKRILQAHSVA